MKITKVDTDVIRIPLDKPIGSALGEIRDFGCVLVTLTTESGVTGENLIFTLNNRRTQVLCQMVNELSDLVIGCDAGHIAHFWAKAWKDINFFGHKGISIMGISALDGALWDAFGKSLNAPLYRLLGGAKTHVPAYHSGGLWLSRSIPELVEEAESFVDMGFKAIKIKLGDVDAQRDLHVVAEVRRMIGSEVTLMVDYNQSLSPKEAIRRIQMIEPYDIHWVEEPVAAEDLQGHATVRQSVNVGIQTGENWWFPRDAERAMSAHACDMMMPDLMKIGGITGWLSVMGMASAASMPVSSHIFIEASSHVLPVTPTCHWLEFMDFGSMIMAEPYVINNGAVSAKGPGLGMAWDESAVARYAVN